MHQYQERDREGDNIKQGGKTHVQDMESVGLKGHCIEFKYYADGIHSGLTPPG